MSEHKKPYIFVIGNEKGGAGKTTCSMHLIVSLLDKGYRVASVDTDSRQQSLTSYINNRKKYNQQNSDKRVPVSLHFVTQEVVGDEEKEKKRIEQEKFEQIIDVAKKQADYIVVDTPGSYSNYSRLAHSYADTIITPVNDSFIDLDVMAKIDHNKAEMSMPSIYSQMIWDQKMQRAERDGGSINWFVMRNRLSNLDAVNKRKVSDALAKLSKRISFNISPGFSERVIFRELFPVGLTLLDLKRANFDKSFSLSHIAARQELRDFLECIGVK
ncbi:MAG: hypothetical protein DGJ47_000127 [Rickettsiaceae bacterium]